MGEGHFIEKSIDLRLGSVLGTSSQLKVGQALHRLLQALCSDFYRPLRTSSLSSQVYPDDVYHPEHSLVKTKSLLYRLREWFRESQVPLTTLNDNGTYRLSASKRVNILIGRPTNEKQDPRLVQLLSAQGQITSQKVSMELGMNNRTAIRFLKRAILSGEIKRRGSGNQTYYVKAS